MKVSSIRLALPTIILAIAFSAAGQAKDLDRADRSKGALPAKIEYCKTCHGLSGQGYRGFFPIPRLAGQQTEYIENQLAAFIERRRGKKNMYQRGDSLHILVFSFQPRARRKNNRRRPKMSQGLLWRAGGKKNLWRTGGTKKIYFFSRLR